MATLKDAAGEICLRRRRVTHSGDEDPNPATTSNNDSLASELENQDGSALNSNSVFHDDTPREQSTLLERRLSASPSGMPTERLKLIIGEDADVAAASPEEIKSEESLLKPKKLGVLEFVWMELTRGYSLQNDQDRYTEKRRKVYAFMRIPYELEKFLFYGFLQCLDAFCHVFTFLPIRIVMTFLGLILRIKQWTSADTCDILKISIIITASYIMQFVDTSMMYHLVRGQGVIKLYIFYNMLEVADKLFSSFGQDILDALMWTASEKGGKRRFISTIFHLMFTTVYALIHAVLVLLQATTLNVAFNSHNQSLLTIMMSNNFVELKGAVFKKFAKPNLFQMSCSDVRERFHTVILLVVVVLRNMTAVNWKMEHLIEMLPDLAMVMIAELIVDWLKHAFITKFNEINAEVYKDFTITLAFDVVRTHEKHAFSDFSDQVSRRMGFIPIPISIMLIRVISQSIDFSSKFYVTIFVLIWLLLCAIKVLNGVFLHGKAVEHVIHYRNLQAQTEYELYRKRMLAAKSKSAPSSPRLSLIDFPDVLTQATRVPKGFTASDILSQWEELSNVRCYEQNQLSARRREQAEERKAMGEETPRRTQSMADFASARARRDSSMPPTITEEDRAEPAAEVHREAARSQASPKRRVPQMECESLSDVQAYTLLNATEAVQEIQS
ncbi:Protein F26F2.7 [Aphelenchoides avenae]|nr:Protein F26F2.7 [Aphelenchus avenae]